MSNFTALKTAIQNAIRNNGNQEITGDVLQNILISMVETMGDNAINDLEILTNQIKINTENGYFLAGIATTTTKPVTGKVFYLAQQAGTYTNFGNLNVPQGITILRKSENSWVAEIIYKVNNVTQEFDPNLVNGGGVFKAVFDGISQANESYNVFTPYFSRRGKCVSNNDKHGPITDFVNGTIVMTGFIRITEDCQYITYEGLTVGKGLRIRFGNYTEDVDDTAITMEIEYSSGYITLDKNLRKYKYFCMNIYRSTTIGEIPDLSSVSIKFNRASSREVADKILFGGNMLFDKSYVRYDKAINSTYPYQILDYKVQKSVITGFIKLDDDVTSISYSGLVVGNGLRVRFSNDTTDNGEAIAQDIDNTSGVIDTRFINYRYVVFAIYRNANTNVFPDISSVNITFNREPVSCALLKNQLRGVDNGENVFLPWYTRQRNLVINSVYPYDIVPLGKFNKTIVTSDFYKIPETCGSISYRNLVVGNGLRARFSKTADDSVSDAIIVEIESASGTINITDEMKGYPFFCIMVYRNENSDTHEYYSSLHDVEISFNEGYVGTSRDFSPLLKSIGRKNTPSISPRKGIVTFVVDGGTYFFASTSVEFDNLLMQYGFEDIAYAILPETMNTESNKVFVKQFANKGREICIHSDTRISGATTPELYDTLMQTYFSDMYAAGIEVSDGYISLNGADVPSLPVLKKYCGWAHSGPRNISMIDADYMDAINSLSTDPCHLNRLNIEQTPAQHTAEITQTIISRAQEVIDDVIANKGYIVLYTHSYKQTGASYTLYEDVLLPILQYLKQKKEKGLLNLTSPRAGLADYYTKRYNEQ